MSLNGAHGLADDRRTACLIELPRAPRFQQAVLSNLTIKVLASFLLNDLNRDYRMKDIDFAS